LSEREARGGRDLDLEVMMEGLMQHFVHVEAIVHWMSGRVREIVIWNTLKFPEKGGEGEGLVNDDQLSR
jgi:hypothetical protein